jgi:hypothetical protein
MFLPYPPSEKIKNPYKFLHGNIETLELKLNEIEKEFEVVYMVPSGLAYTILIKFIN